MTSLCILGRTKLGPLLCAALAIGASSAAFAADSPLDEASAEVTKAIAAIKAAPAGSDSAEAHKKKAVEFLTRAQSELLKAKAAE